MELSKIEEYIDCIYDNIRELLRTNPRVSGWSTVFETYDSENYRYTFNTSCKIGEEPVKTYIFSTNSSECIFKILNSTNELIYITQNNQYRMDLDMSEEWHFQQMTVKPLISYESLTKIRKIYEIIQKR